MIRKPGNLATAPLACLMLVFPVLSGCHVDTHKNGSNDNVDISTPFGSVKVDTNNSSDTAAIGLAAYPGAVPITDSGDKGGNSANVNMSFGSFHLGVKAASFQTSDPQDKVLAFYRKDLAAHFGDVIACKGNHAVGTPIRTSQGLTCEDEGRHGKINIDTSDHDVELRTGSEQHQHIVEVEDHDGGTKIGLVALDLPSHLSVHGSKDSE